ncbi:hypothetical protein L209DRAFT_752996 [Thermothelomyces heterothallicus CBS 203.75]
MTRADNDQQDVCFGKQAGCTPLVLTSCTHTTLLRALFRTRPRALWRCRSTDFVCFADGGARIPEALDLTGLARQSVFVL